MKSGITDNINSIYDYYTSKRLNINKEYKKYSEFPNMKDLLDSLLKEKSIPSSITKELRKQTIFNKVNIENLKKLDDKFDSIILFNFKNANADSFKIYLNYLEQYYGENMLIYVDEMWKFINLSCENNIDSEISNLFKTIRKKRAGIVIATQDIHDILKYKEGIFGKSILNNSFTKLFFKMQYIDLNTLQDVGLCSEETFKNIRKLGIGSAYMSIGDNKFNIDIKTSDFEKTIIGGESL